LPEVARVGKVLPSPCPFHPMHANSPTGSPSSRLAVTSARHIAAVLVAVAMANTATAQIAAPRSHAEPVFVASGEQDNPLPIETVVWQDFVNLPAGTPWLRLQFAQANLAEGSYLRIAALRDGEVMTMRHEHVVQWNHTSAYFNGDTVLVQLVAGANTTGNEVTIRSVLAGDLPGADPDDTICGSTDDRVPSTDTRTGRLSNGCTGWIINTSGGGLEKLHLSAGHCFSATAVLQFSVPASNSNCSLVQPPVSKQFAVDAATSQYVNGGVGNDYWVYRCFPNSTTGLTTFQEQGAAFTLATSMPALGATVRNIGYGVDGTDTNAAAASSSCSCSGANGTGTRNQTQQTNTGALVGTTGTTLRHQADTCGGNSGSPLFDDATGLALAIHTHGGCSTSSTSANSGTQVTHPGLQAAIASMCPTCAKHTAYGTSCFSARSFYEAFAANGSDLVGKTLTATRNAQGGYDVSTAPLTTFAAPTGTGLALTDDVVAAAQTLPFTFDFAGGSTTTIRIDSNGRVHLGASGTSSAAPTTTGLLTSATPLIAGFWADLLPDGATNTRNVFVHSPVVGTYCITWNNVPFFSAAGAITFQIALIDNGTNDRVEVRYQALTTPNLASVVGISPGGTSVDPGPRDLTAGSFSTASDLPMLTLRATPAPLLGATVTYTVSNVRPIASLTQLFANFTSLAPTPFTALGLDAPGCMLHVPLNSVSFGPLLLTNPTANYAYTMPTGASFLGLSIFVQAIELATGNPAGLISSNGLQSLLNNQ
jgi:hypothetical protein